ncbi:hypothetical protein [Klebsiella quasipneumoniae]|uniref:hypothetical protein n=1 Tax=Klebsiella quasipneumoniae TaxID=1463165 RepID=UPI0010826975|nr:hypothetical protein [Klebsiella quasipneumoniae]
MKYYIYPSAIKIGDDAVMLEITSVQREVRLFAEFECDDILDVILTGQNALFDAGFDTSSTVLTMAD